MPQKRNDVSGERLAIQNKMAKTLNSFKEILLLILATKNVYFIFDIVTTFSLCCLVRYKEKRPIKIISQKNLFCQI